MKPIIVQYLVEIPVARIKKKEQLVISFSFSLIQTNSYLYRERRSGLMVSAFVPGASGPGSSPGRGHCVVFLGKTLNSHGASLHPGV